MTELTIEADEVQQIKHAARQWGDRFRLYREVWAEQLGDELADRLIVVYAMNFHRVQSGPSLDEQMKAMEGVMRRVLNPESDDEL